jgi:hypothetical protein
MTNYMDIIKVQLFGNSVEPFCSYWQIILTILVSLRHISTTKEDLVYELLVNVVEISKISFVLLKFIIIYICRLHSNCPYCQIYRHSYFNTL